MKIVHIADIHWRGLSRHKEYCESFNDFFKKCKDLNPDVIYVGGDIVHSKTQGISPELIDNLRWWFDEMSLIAPTHIILGNHDGLIHNKDRQDAITPIINALDNNNLFLYKKSGTYPTGIPGFNWCVLSCFDEENYSKAIPVEGEVNIALYHGAVRGSLTDTDWQLEGEINISAFSRYEFAMLGDIHKRQFLNEAKTIAYPGSTIQQNYGESGEKGFLFWDIRSASDFDVSFHPIIHNNPFVTVDWQGSVEATIQKCSNFNDRSRFRIRTDDTVTHVECKRIQGELLRSKNAKEVVFKSESSFDPRKAITSTDNTQKNLRDPSVHKEMFRDFYKDKDINDDTWDSIDEMIDKYVHGIENSDETLRNIKWEINNIKFSNLFAYGEDNFINFDSLPGITGIFGTNARGKSSIIGSIVYALFNGTDRGSIKNLHVINTRKNSCSASITLTINGQRYRIDRKTIKKNAKAGVWAPTSLQFYRVDKNDNVIDDLTEEQRRETEKIVRGLIGNVDDFLLTSLASQGEMNTFIKEKASARKQILTNFLDLEVFDKLHELVRKDAQEVKYRFKSLCENNWDARILEKRQTVTSLNKSLKDKKKEISNLKEEIDKIKDDLRNKDTSIVLRTDVEKAYDMVISQEKKIEKDEDKISSLQEGLEAKIEKLKKLDDFLDEFDISEMKEKRSAQINLEHSIKDMQHKIDLIKRDIKQSKKSVSILDQVPCGDEYPSCRFIKDSHKNKKLLIAQEANLISLNTNLSDLRSLYRKVKDPELEEKIEKYEKIVAKKSELVNKNTATNLELAKLQENIKWYHKNLTKYQNEYERLSYAYTGQDKDDNSLTLENLCDEKIRNLKKLEGEHVRIINKLAENKASLKSLERDRKIYDELKVKNRNYDLFSHAVSKKGIPLLIINNMLPAINAEISKILAGVVGFTVDIDTDLETNSLDVYINYGDSRRIIELASGMEKMMASLAIRVALINVSSLSKTNMLMIDEGFGTLDETNLEACNRLLISLKKWFKNIVVISHVDAIKDCVDHNLDILKRGKNSYVNHV